MIVQPHVIDTVIAHARRTRPGECCGLLIGRPGIIERSAPARNVRRSLTRYLIHPGDHFAAIRIARGDGLAVLGAYHSHPTGPAEPSVTDMAESVDDNFLCMIVSLAGRTPTVRVFRLWQDRFERVDIRPVDDGAARRLRRAGKVSG